MAVKFSQSFTTLFTAGCRWMFNNGSNVGVTVYGGSRPSSDSVISSWSTYNQNSTLCLWHASTGVTMQVLGSTTLNAATLPTAAAPLRNGTATWFILWSINNVNINTTTIPTTKFMIGDVTGLFGDGIMRFSNTTLSTSTPTTFSELSFLVSYTG